MIEVKAFGKSNRGYDLWLETRQVEKAPANPHFCVYVVEHVRQGDPARYMLRVLCTTRTRSVCYSRWSSVTAAFTTSTR